MSNFIYNEFSQSVNASDILPYLETAEFTDVVDYKFNVSIAYPSPSSNVTFKFVLHKNGTIGEARQFPTWSDILEFGENIKVRNLNLSLTNLTVD